MIPERQFLPKNATSQDVKTLYDPRSVLMVLNPEEAKMGDTAAIYFGAQGLSAQSVTDPMDASILIGTGNYDVLVTGEGLDEFAELADKLPGKKHVMKIAVSDNGAPAQHKFGSMNAVLSYAMSGWVREHYRSHEPAQAYRAAQDVPKATPAELESMLLTEMPR